MFRRIKFFIILPIRKFFTRMLQPSATNHTSGELNEKLPYKCWISCGKTFSPKSQRPSLESPLAKVGMKGPKAITPRGKQSSKKLKVYLLGKPRWYFYISSFSNIQSCLVFNSDIKYSELKERPSETVIDFLK